MKKQDLLKKIRIDKLDDSTVFIQNQYVSFSYTKPDKIIKEEYVDRYRYFGGLQCDFPEESIEYKNIENWLCEIAEKLLNK